MFDFGITDNGELIFDNQNKDINKNQKDGLVRQIALCRIKSVVSDWFNTTIGANLEEFIGYVCNENTCNLIMDAIENSLIYDDFMSRKELFFIPKVDANSISVLVFINSREGNDPSMINVTIDIVGGVKVTYDPYK